MSTVETIYFEPPFSDEEMKQTQAWFRHYGVDPSDVPRSGWVERHPREIHVLVYARNEQGDRYVNEGRTDAVTEILIIELDEPPLPFPAAV